jgi:hypothetical protein
MGPGMWVRVATGPATQVRSASVGTAIQLRATGRGLQVRAATSVGPRSTGPGMCRARAALPAGASRWATIPVLALARRPVSQRVALHFPLASVGLRKARRAMAPLNAVLPRAPAPGMVGVLVALPLMMRPVGALVAHRTPALPGVARLAPVRPPMACLRAVSPAMARVVAAPGMVGALVARRTPAPPGTARLPAAQPVLARQVPGLPAPPRLAMGPLPLRHPVTMPLCRTCLVAVVPGVLAQPVTHPPQALPSTVRRSPTRCSRTRPDIAHPIKPPPAAHPAPVGTSASRPATVRPRALGPAWTSGGLRVPGTVPAVLVNLAGPNRPAPVVRPTRPVRHRPMPYRSYPRIPARTRSGCTFRIKPDR